MDIEKIVRLKKLENLVSNGGLVLMDMNINSLLDEEQKKRKSKILNDLKSVRKGFQFSPIPEKKEYTPTYTKMDLKTVDEEEINKDATDSLKYYKAKELSDIESDYATQKSELNSKLKTQVQNAEDKENAIREDAKNQRTKTQNALVNRGVAHGSIYDSMMTEIEKQELSNLQNQKQEAESKISSLNEDLAKLDAKKQNALELFNISYASKLQDEINAIKEELDDYNTKTNKYNESIEEKNKALILKYDEAYTKQVKQAEDRNKQILAFMQQYGYGTIEDKIQRQQTAILRDYLNTLSKNSALEILTEDDEFKNELGEKFYNKILSEVKDRVA